MAAETFSQGCAGCGLLIDLQWDNGVILPGDVVLAADVVFHAHCWDAAIKEHPLGLAPHPALIARPEGRASFRTPYGATFSPPQAGRREF